MKFDKQPQNQGKITFGGNTALEVDNQGRRIATTPTTHDQAMDVVNKVNAVGGRGTLEGESLLKAISESNFPQYSTEAIEEAKHIGIQYMLDDMKTVSEVSQASKGNKKK